MDKRSWVATGCFGLIAVVLAAVSVAGVQKLADAEDRQSVARADLDAANADNEHAQPELATLQVTLDDLDTRLSELRPYFTVDTVAAIVQVQTQMVEAGCTLARTATRDGSVLPTVESLVGYVKITGGQAQQALAGLDERWTHLLDTAALQAQIDGCAAAETAAMEAERQAAKEAEAARRRQEASAPKSGTCGYIGSQGEYVPPDCYGFYTPDGVFHGD